MESIISMNDMSKEEILNILELARKIDETPDDEKLKFLYGKIIATLFFEPSTRTKMSFESAAQRLGAQVLQLPPVEQSSLKKGESFRDTIKMVEAYSDLIVVRHPLDGAARLADETSKRAIINAGDGSNQHPSQTLLDLYTILEEKGSLENLEIAFVGDLKYGRTVHSLVKALTHFNPKIYFIAPQILQMPQYLLDELDKNNIKYEVLEDFRDCLDKIDVFYMTRIQKERFPDIEDYEQVKGIYVINKENILGKCKDDMIILHPLPRVDEISTDLDDTKHALYFKQARNGIPVRQAMMMTVLGKVKEFF
ncbi:MULTISPECIES: aspartate carbamoyltransferase [unclassified Leptotrichia]|uniref:aspartate carbamoyltransferase n=1 Tax=unclassified Leptotrichia TaxID=2633022 RepID=UPI0017EBDC9F|nr:MULTISPECIES: aspartate carbamoyltransferase [unclassified Leptotrichia]MBB1534435.1 aspartate carbamoyltransferase [Leptotrichia sp.]QUB96605.1 aspartate carbamoyltransferase [Leptotrichia sp. oral taxon 221]